ncbi:uncharacterized protein TNCV_2700301 [Trichonephila clavipes]|nr:uncharacterized protein TNCV_2700301 [Trichonephila clavipes]
MERTHQSLKAAFMAHSTPRWTQVLPFVLLGLCTVIIEDINAAAELVYGTTIRLPSDFFQDTGTNNVSEFVDQLKQTMNNLKPVSTSSLKLFLYTQNSSNVFTCFYEIMRSENPYSLPTMDLSL